MIFAISPSIFRRNRVFSYGFFRLAMPWHGFFVGVTRLVLGWDREAWSPVNICTWGEHGTYGTYMGPIWDLYGTYMGPIWDLYGTYMGPIWDLYGTYMGPMGP